MMPISHRPLDITPGLTFTASEPIPKPGDQGTQLVFTKGRGESNFP